MSSAAITADDGEIITFKVKGQHVKPSEMRSKKRVHPDAGMFSPTKPSPSCTPVAPSSSRRPAFALRDLTNVASESKTTIKAARMPFSPAVNERPAHKRRRLGVKVAGEYALLSQVGPDEWSFSFMHTGVSGVVQGLPVAPSKEEISEAIAKQLIQSDAVVVVTAASNEEAPHAVAVDVQASVDAAEPSPIEVPAADISVSSSLISMDPLAGSPVSLTLSALSPSSSPRSSHTVDSNDLEDGSPVDAAATDIDADVPITAFITPFEDISLFIAEGEAVCGETADEAVVESVVELPPPTATLTSDTVALECQPCNEPQCVDAEAVVVPEDGAAAVVMPDVDVSFIIASASEVDADTALSTPLMESSTSVESAAVVDDSSPSGAAVECAVAADSASEVATLEAHVSEQPAVAVQVTSDVAAEPEIVTAVAEPVVERAIVDAAASSPILAPAAAGFPAEVAACNVLATPVAAAPSATPLRVSTPPVTTLMDVPESCMATPFASAAEMVACTPLATVLASVVLTDSDVIVALSPVGLSVPAGAPEAAPVVVAAPVSTSVLPSPDAVVPPTPFAVMAVDALGRFDFAMEDDVEDASECAFDSGVAAVAAIAAVVVTEETSTGTVVVDEAAAVTELAVVEIEGVPSADVEVVVPSNEEVPAPLPAAVIDEEEVVVIPEVVDPAHVAKYSEAEVDVIRRQAEALAMARMEAELEVEKSKLAAMWRADVEAAVTEAINAKASLEKAVDLKNQFWDMLKVLEQEHSELEVEHAKIVLSEKEARNSTSLAEAKVAALQAERGELQNKLLSCMEHRETLETQKAVLLADKVELERQLASTKAYIADVTSKLSAAEQAAAASQLVNSRTVEAYTSKLEQKKVEFMRLKEENAALTASVADLTSQLAITKGELAKAEAEVKAQSATFTAAANKDKDAIASLEAQLGHANIQLEAVTSESVLRLRKLQEVTSEHSACGDYLSTAQAEAAAQIAALQAQNAKVISQMESDARDMKVKLYDTTAENRRLVEENAKLAAQETELLGYVSTLQEKCGLV